MKRQEAFTLIELIIVMGVILTFVGLAVVDFRGSKQEQETVQMVEEVRALLQQSRSRVYAGQTLEGRFVCEGVLFENGKRPMQAVMPVNEEGLCDELQVELSEYGMQQGNPYVSRGGGAYLLYTPPSANLIAMRVGGFDYLDEELLIRFANSEDVDRFELETRIDENHFSISAVSDEE